MCLSTAAFLPHYIKNHTPIYYGRVSLSKNLYRYQKWGLQQHLGAVRRDDLTIDFTGQKKGLPGQRLLIGRGTGVAGVLKDVEQRVLLLG